MTKNNPLKTLSDHCEASFHLEYNPHKSMYETVPQYLAGIGGNEPFYDEVGEINPDLDIWTIQVYPKTPIGFVCGASNDLDRLVIWAIEAAKEY